jgi:hypothetical protein
MKIGKWVAGFVHVALVTALAAVFVAAQVGTSTVTGTVTDPQGNVISGATVRLISSQGAVRTVVTNDSGVYVFPSVQTGTYKIEVEQAGFKKSSVANVRALVDISTEINVRLELGEVSEVVNVDAASLESVVNTQDASLGNNFVSRQILSLPLLGRNVANLLSLQAGVTPDGSVTGGRADQANITLDGIDVNNQQNASAFETVLRVNPDSVDEFRVTTSNPDASKGRSSGAQISLITKSGSNEFRGALYEYHRNTATTANDWFNNRARIERPKLIRNLFGGRLGGPIVKDRLFFFYNYEGMRQASGVSVARSVPTASLAAGNIQFVDNTGQSWTITTPQINSFTLTGGSAAGPVVDVNPAVVALFQQVVAKYPVNDSTIGDGRNTGGFRFNASTGIEQNAHTAKFDWYVTRDQKHQVSFRGNYQQDIFGAPSYFPDTPATSRWSHPLGFAATHTWLINSSLTNRFSYGLSRLAFSDQGDSTDPQITFRYIFQPVGFARTFARTNPTTNITNDTTWIRGNHSFQFGTNFRFIKNTRLNFARSYDNAITNPSAYASNVARVVINQYITAVTGSPRSVASAWDVPVQGALVALLGRLNGYGANFNFNVNGVLQPAGSGVRREFKTEEYDFYFQDTWKIRPNLTLTAGIRYGLSFPVTETQGFETVPSIVLSEYLRRSIFAMNQGINYREPLSVRLAGKSNGLDSIYPLDKNNWQPRLSIAWSPEFEKGFWSKVFGKGSESVIRAGFSITNDYFGQQLATNWDGSNTLGFSSSSSINVNTYNITTNPAPLYTGPSMNIRALPNLTIPTGLSFPQTAPFTNPGQGKIETSLDQELVSPINYSWNVSYGRRLPWDIWVDAAYVARLARNLLIGRDAMMLRDIRDPRSGLSYFEASRILDVLKQANAPATSVPDIPFFNNMWAPGTIRNAFGCPAGTGPNCTNSQAVYGLAGPLGAGDWTYMMQLLDQFMGTRYFFQGQYDALSAFSTVGTSDYHAGTLSIRQRTKALTWDFNYTFSKSMDEASGLQTGGLYGSTFVLNAYRLRDQRAVSDFDNKHLINFNGIWDIPIGRDRRYGRGMNKFLNALIGGWQLSGVYRWNSGYPWDGWYDGTGWQTNWQVRSYMTQLRPLSTGYFYGSAASSCTSGCDIPNMFANPDQAWAAFRTPHPGETGTRNPVRLPGTWNIDAGLAKSFDMPWKETHKITIRWDTFNVTNTPFFTGQATGIIGYTGSSATGNFGRYTQMANLPRIMQFAFRYDF